MIRFECDYGEGCVPKILERMAESNQEQTPGYGMDEHSERARAYIREKIGRPDAFVQFLVGGTQANLTVLAAALRPHQGVLAAQTGHVAVHESGAIEATGHKVLPLSSSDGKITAQQVQEALDAHFSDPHAEHMVQPGMLYISQPTENGTLYSLSELTAISKACHDHNVPLYVDGARLGYALASPKNDVSLTDLARLSDVFYIGGTKVGALFGEALVILNESLKKDFRYIIKQRGGMLAKGRLLGIQFECLFEDDTYQEISAHAVNLALQMREAFLKKGWELLFDSYTNQQFPIIPDEQLKPLSEKYAYDFWEKRVGKTAVRFCASWATRREDVDALIRDIERL